MMTGNTIVIATRKSRLALWQTQFVKNKLQHLYPNIKINLLTKVTEGDKRQDIALSDIGGKNLFTKELQSTLLTKEADIAVHSIKDLSAQPQPGLVLAAFCQRHDPRDAFISTTYQQFVDLPHQAIVGTSSPRRQCQLLALRPDLNIKLLRGNVDTRLSKLAQHQYDAIVLAAAGLQRLELDHLITEYFPLTKILPAIGQGAIGIECLSENQEIQQLLQPLDHQPTRYCVEAERAVNARLNGDCYTPIAAHASLVKDKLTLVANVGNLTGSKILTAKSSKISQLYKELGNEVAELLIKQGAISFLQNH